jgi:hypothetical protein
MIKLKSILLESNISGMPSGNNSARWTAPGQSRKINIPQLSGYEQVDFPTADSLDISNEPYQWESEGRTKKYHNKVRAVRGENGVLTFEGIKLTDILCEVAYDGNLGFHEMYLFYGNASDNEIDKLESFIKRKKFKEAWRLVQKVTGVKLKGKEFESVLN